ILRGIEEGWFSAQIAEAAFDYQRKLETGVKKIVGVNCHTASVSHPLEIMRVSHDVERDQNEHLATRRAERDDEAVQRCLADLAASAAGSDNMIPSMMAAVRAEATLGEICNILRQEWGIYREPARF
ncbi:MAG: methylmalonyl-CoA mutase family protein, partial [Ornithinimicrobium sp.]